MDKSGIMSLINIPLANFYQKQLRMTPRFQDRATGYLLGALTKTEKEGGGTDVHIGEPKTLNSVWDLCG